MNVFFKHRSSGVSFFVKMNHSSREQRESEAPQVTMSEPIFVCAWDSEDVLVSSEPSLYAVDEWHEHRHHSRAAPENAAPAIGDMALAVVCYGVTQDGRDSRIVITGAFRRVLVRFPDEGRLDAHFGDAVDALVWHLGNEIDGTQFKLVSHHKGHAGKRFAVEVRLGSNRAARRLLEGGISAETFPFLDPRVHRIEMEEPVEGAESTLRAARRLPEVGWIVCRVGKGKDGICPMRDVHPATLTLSSKVLIPAK